MKPLNFTIIKLTICLITGILISHGFDLKIEIIFYIVAIALVLTILTYSLSKQRLNKTIWFGVMAYLLMSSIGLLIYSSHDQKMFKQHYSNADVLNKDQEDVLIFKIREHLKPTAFHNKYIIDIIKLNDKTVDGKMLLNVKKDNLKTTYNVDEILVVNTFIKPIKSPLNPNQFDYSSYLKKQYIYHQLFVGNNSILKINSNQTTIYGHADKLRKHINKKIDKYNFKPEVINIVNALILGQRQNMDKITYENYAKAGAIHILAVSGLHIGIILLLLNFIFKPLLYLKHGKAIRVILILILLWSFAVVAGLSASVTRAVTMFSIIALAMHLKRTANIYNTLAISIFILLLFKPMFLFDVGFQMSYLAVLSIVSIQPMIYKLWIPKWKIINYFWQIFTVTIAAQFGVVPVSLYYFHQFPGLFIISNMAIIPFLGIILGLGIIIIVLALCNLLPKSLASLYDNLISSMNSLVNWVSKQEPFLIKDVSFNLLHVILAYTIIIIIVLLIKKPNFKRVLLLCIGILLIQIGFIVNKIETSKNAFVIFHKSRHTIIAQKTNTHLKVWHNLNGSSVKNTIVNNFKIGNFIKSIDQDSIRSVYQINSKNLLIVDSLDIYNIKGFKADYVLLRNSPRINLKRLIDSLQPKLIIADGSNYKTYQKRWKATCVKEKLLFHQTSEKGALIIK
ncbi:ComEC/Rec2 family competence protein [uncultured Psychroserpens sp.]|uniref:ComEC/Rec2 family competence protein n=1 Tax=uncultured Psychroserpens sp. TaxID=255436 RepID=UPI00261D0F6D|nr:ComEC/Rec2 family competence protein [uncultured Psychroserpens sp.]